MAQHGIFGVADKGLDFQVLFDEAEKDFDLPAFLIDIGDGLGRQLKMVGEKDIAPAGGGVPVGNAPQGNGTFLGLKPDGLVGEQALLFIDFPALQHLVAGVTLLAGDEENFLSVELGIPVIIGVPHILHHNGAFGQAETAGSVDFVLPSLRDGHKGGQIAVVVQEGMEFDAALGAPEASPGKEGDTEAYHGGIQAEQLIFEAEFVLRGQRLATPVHQGKQRFKKGGGALVVGIGKGGASHRLDSQVVEAFEARFQAGDAITETGSGRKLHGEQVHQLAPTVKDRAFRPVLCSVSNLAK